MASSVAWALLRWAQPSAPELLLPARRASEPLVRQILDLEDAQLTTFMWGLLSGLAFGPLVDLGSLARRAWRRALRQALPQRATVKKPIR